MIIRAFFGGNLFPFASPFGVDLDDTDGEMEHDFNPSTPPDFWEDNDNEDTYELAA